MKIRKLLLSFVMSVLFTTLSFSAIYTVISTADDGTPGTLRWAVAQSIATSDYDVIDFNLPPGSVIVLTSSLNVVNDPFVNAGFTTIQGPGADLLTISGNGTIFALINIRNGDIYNVTLTGGISDNSVLASAVNVFGDGSITTLNGVKINNCTGTMGTVQMNSNGGTLNIYNSIISGNAGANNGCGVKHASYNGGTINIVNSTITRNRALYGGGGVNNESGGPFFVSNSIIANNASDFNEADVRGTITPGTTNLIGVDPLFVMDVMSPSAGGDFNLQDGSPALDVGTNAEVPPPPFQLLDIAGNPRISNTTVDLGAYEKLPPPEVDVTKTDEFLDEDNDGIVDFGETIRYTIVASNAAMVSDALNVVFDSSVDPNTSLNVGSVTTSQGSVTTGNGGGDNSVSVDVGTLVSGTSVTITFDVAVTFAGNGSFVSCQGTVSGSNFDSVLTDDPDEAGDMDPTLTAIPTLSQWGIIGLSLIMLIFGLVVVRQRKIAM